LSERTFFMIKPDGVARGLIADIKQRVVSAGYTLVAEKTIQMEAEQAKKLYAVHKGQPFYPGLVAFITSGKVFVSVVEGEGAILGIRKLMGATDPRKAQPGTIRGDLREENVISASGTIKNVVHGSDSPASAKHEIPIFFAKELEV